MIKLTARIKALGTLMKDVPFHPVNNPVVFNLDWPGHPQHNSCITLKTFKELTHPGVGDVS